MQEITTELNKIQLIKITNLIVPHKLIRLVCPLSEESFISYSFILLFNSLSACLNSQQLDIFELCTAMSLAQREY